MDEIHTTYTESKHCSSNKQIPRKKCSVTISLCKIALTFGALCLLILLALRILQFMDFQRVQEFENNMKKLVKYPEFQKSFNENKEVLKSLGNQNEYIIEFFHEMETIHEPSCNAPQHPWVRHRRICYFKTQQMVPWSNCSDLCVSFNAEFLRTERSKLKIIMKLLPMNHTWLGVYYSTENHKWTWANGFSPSLSLHMPERGEGFGNCVYATEDQFYADNCSRSLSCMCEKMLDKNFRKKHIGTENETLQKEEEDRITEEIYQKSPED